MHTKATVTEKIMSHSRAFTQAHIRASSPHETKTLTDLDHESHVLARELTVHTRERLELVLQAGCILRVERAAHELATVSRHAQALGSNLSWEHKVLQDGVVHPGESAATGPRLLSTAVAGRLAEDATLANEHDVVVRELLLEFTCEPVWC